MLVKDAIDGNFVFATEKFRLDYLQDLKKEANQRAQAQAAIISLLLPTVLLLAEHLSKSNDLERLDMSLLVASLLMLLGSLALALIVLVPIPTLSQSAFSHQQILTTSLAEPRDNGSFSLDVVAIREEARLIAILLRRRDRLLRASAALLGSSIGLSTVTLVRFVL